MSVQDASALPSGPGAGSFSSARGADHIKCRHLTITFPQPSICSSGTRCRDLMQVTHSKQKANRFCGRYFHRGSESHDSRPDLDESLGVIVSLRLRKTPDPAKGLYIEKSLVRLYPILEVLSISLPSFFLCGH